MTKLKPYVAPDLATVNEWVHETGRSRFEAYRMLHAGFMPHLRISEQLFRVLMPAYRRMVVGEPIDAGLLAGRPATIRQGANA